MVAAGNPLATNTQGRLTPLKMWPSSSFGGPSVTSVGGFGLINGILGDWNSGFPHYDKVNPGTWATIASIQHVVDCSPLPEVYLLRKIHECDSNDRMDSLNFGRKLLPATVEIAAVAGLIAIGVLYALSSRAQSQAETISSTFEVASVKPNRSTNGTTRRIEPGTITYLNITLGEFIEMAYGVKHYQLSGPDWIVNWSSSYRYDVVAKAGGPVAAEQLQRMLGPLLTDRFHLAFHRVTRELPVFALVVAKNGPKFKVGDGGTESVSPDGTGGASYMNYSMASLAYSLSLRSAVGRPVLDRTGLKGGYSFNANLDNVPQGLNPAELKNALVNSDAIFSTLQEQLGLRLKSQKAPVEILVIDHAEQVPTEN